MKIFVNLISKEIIKPSTPTPNHNHRYQLSVVDINNFDFHTPFIYFYNSNNNISNKNILNDLKVSLSKVLTHYYLLAGRINFEDNYVDCNDWGVIFLEARINCQLSEIIEDPRLPSEFNKFLPYENVPDRELPVDVCLAIQVNLFNCGSVAIGVLMSHKVGDASSLFTFMNNWAATARGGSENLCVQLVGASLFPAPKDVIVNYSQLVISWKNVVLRRFVFSSSKIASLRKKYTNSTISEQSSSPTSYEALSAFILSRFTTATKTNRRPAGISHLLLRPVNLRNKMDPPLPGDSFGNLVGNAITFLAQNNAEESSHGNGLVYKIRDSIGKVDTDFVKKLQNEKLEFYLDIVLKEYSERIMKGEVITWSLSSLRMFSIYDADFGWGRPRWVAYGGSAMSNIVVLMNTKHGDGIEAWMVFGKEDMAKFESDLELHAYACPTSRL